MAAAGGGGAAAARAYSFKVVLLGEGCVGKTSLVLRYCENKFNDKHITTLQVRAPGSGSGALGPLPLRGSEDFVATVLCVAGLSYLRPVTSAFGFTFRIRPGDGVCLGSLETQGRAVGRGVEGP